MRIISIVLFIQILLLSGMSCADAMELNSHDTIIKTVVDHPLDSLEDMCSPFCSCACCIGCAHPIAAKVYVAKPLLADHSNYYLEASYHRIDKSLFQPPRA